MKTRQLLFMMAVAIPSWMEPARTLSVLGQFVGPDDVHDGKKMLVAVVLLLLLQNEEEANAGPSSPSPPHPAG